MTNHGLGDKFCNKIHAYTKHKGGKLKLLRITWNQILSLSIELKQKKNEENLVLVLQELVQSSSPLKLVKGIKQDQKSHLQELLLLFCLEMKINQAIIIVLCGFSLGHTVCHLEREKCVLVRDVVLQSAKGSAWFFYHLLSLTVTVPYGCLLSGFKNI